MNGRFIDIIEPRKENEQTGDEIARDIIKRAGLEVADYGFDGSEGSAWSG